MRPSPRGARSWPGPHDRAPDVERFSGLYAANAVAVVFEDAQPVEGGDPAEMRAHAREAAVRLERMAAEFIDAASQAHRRAAELRRMAEGIDVVPAGSQEAGATRDTYPGKMLRQQFSLSVRVMGGAIVAAERLGCSRAYVDMIAAGTRRPGLETAHAIERVMGIPMQMWAFVGDTQEAA